MDELAVASSLPSSLVIGGALAWVLYIIKGVAQRRRRRFAGMRFTPGV